MHFARRLLLFTAAVFTAALFAFPMATCVSAQLQQEMPRDYRGVDVQIPGIFVTPMPNAPFSAKVDIVSQQKLDDGTTEVRTTINHIARQSSGRIYNERRQMVPPTFKGDPQLLSSHIYDPTTRLNIFLNPFTHLAHESVLPQPPAPPANSVPTRTPATPNPLMKEEELGTQNVGSVALRGIRKSRTVPAKQSGTGQQIVIVDEYWYSSDLSIYMIIKHNDPRTGEQIVAVSEVTRDEPPASIFEVPTKYRVVDETPAE